MIEIKNLQKRYGNTCALEDVSANIPDGCVFGVVGVNGAGKSTLLRLLAGVLRADAEYPSEWARCREIFRSPELQMVSFTITEKGYHIKDLAGNYYPAVQAAFEDASSDKVLGNGMAIIAALLLERFRAGAHPIAMVSMDNFSHNGDKLLDSVRTFAVKWAENGSAPKEFVDYIDGPKVSFPWSMIDKITPRPDASVAPEREERTVESAPEEPREIPESTPLSLDDSTSAERKDGWIASLFRQSGRQVETPVERTARKGAEETPVSPSKSSEASSEGEVVELLSEQVLVEGSGIQELTSADMVTSEKEPAEDGEIMELEETLIREHASAAEAEEPSPPVDFATRLTPSTTVWMELPPAAGASNAPNVRSLP